MEDLLGGALENRQGSHDTADAIQGKTAVALYFAAGWCHVSRECTNKLSAYYRRSLSDKGLLFVLISQDSSEQEFKQHFKSHPWMALPYSDRTRAAELAQRFSVQISPALIIVDAKDGSSINTEALAAVQNDPTGLLFPWWPPRHSECSARVLQMLGNTFVTNHKQTFTRDQRPSTRFVGLLFMERGEGMCRKHSGSSCHFVAKLSELYLQGLSSQLEIIFVSGDREEAAWEQQLAEMPWLAMPWEGDGEQRRGTMVALWEAFQVRATPTLVILDSQGAVLDQNGYGAIVTMRDESDTGMMPGEMPEWLRFEQKQVTVVESVSAPKESSDGCCLLQ